MFALVGGQLLHVAGDLAKGDVPGCVSPPQRATARRSQRLFGLLPLLIGVKSFFVRIDSRFFVTGDESLRHEIVTRERRSSR